MERKQQQVNNIYDISLSLPVKWFSLKFLLFFLFIESRSCDGKCNNNNTNTNKNTRRANNNYSQYAFYTLIDAA